MARSTDERGFTLLEVIIAVAVLALMTTLVWYTFAQVFKTIDYVRADSDLLRQARQATSRIPREFADAYLPVNLTSPIVVVKYEFVGDDRGDLDRVRFQAFAHTKLYQDANESDQSEIEYYTEPEQKPDAKGKRYNQLMRREDATLDDRPDDGGTKAVIASHVKSFNLQYYDQNRDQWVDNWDTNKTDTANRLPYAVRIKLVFIDSDEREREFATATTIRLAKPQEQR